MEYKNVTFIFNIDITYNISSSPYCVVLASYGFTENLVQDFSVCLWNVVCKSKKNIRIFFKRTYEAFKVLQRISFFSCFSYNTHNNKCLVHENNSPEGSSVYLFFYIVIIISYYHRG
jgi:hypothetical protein